ncbi:MAG: ubiquinol-cytochrome C chaperone family protein [Pseudomonadota bacterium]
MIVNLRWLGLGEKAADPRIRAVYDALVRQAREPVFYTSYGVPDTITGRFDLIVLHTFFCFYRSKEADDALRDFGPEVFDTFFEDMDRSLREMGVGYQAVPKRIKKMGEAFYGRVTAYDNALASGEDAEIAEALHRNLFPDLEVAPDNLDRLVRYVRASVDVMTACDRPALIEAEFVLPDPAAFLAEEQSNQSSSGEDGA